MRQFSALFDSIDATTSTLGKVAAMRTYFSTAPPPDAAWAVYFLSGRRLKRLIGPALLQRWLEAASELPDWLVQESLAAVGDLAETIALLISSSDSRTGKDDLSLDAWIRDRLLPLAKLPPERQQELVTGWWRELDTRDCFILNKLLTGSLRVGVSQTLVERAIAEALNIPREVIAHRLMGTWEPGTEFWLDLRGNAQDTLLSRPYPFFLAAALEGEVEALGPREDWLVEWKWDGIRGQIIRRGDECFIWSRGEELITERFPEVTAATAQLPAGTVLDGEILAWTKAGVAPFGSLQKRIGLKKPSQSAMAKTPVRFLAYDLLEFQGQDIRGLSLDERRRLLTGLLNGDGMLGVSPLVEAGDWHSLRALHAQSRSRNVEGFMLKQRTSTYGTGRKKGSWWKWKVDPFTFDGVLIYAQGGSGQRANLFTDYTFGVWSDGRLLPVCKAYSGLTQVEIGELDHWIRQNTLERFGPVRSVPPELVFEIAFEGINASKRHKAGVAVRFPRISRWRKDKPASEADSIEQLRTLLPAS